MLEENSLLRRGAFDPREYQIQITKSCLSANTLVCLPTGLGKSIIAALVAAERIRKQPTKKIAVLAPTKPLAVQHHNTFQKLLQIDHDALVVVTGETPPGRRQESWSGRAFFCTPQVFLNDLIMGRVNPGEFSLIVFDEAHRATGDYAYTFIAEKFKHVSTSLILGLTASPGSTREAIEQICRNLNISKVETRTLESPDVKPYISHINVEWVTLELPEPIRLVKEQFESYIRDHLSQARDFGYIESASAEKIRLRDILRAAERIRTELTSEGGPREILSRIMLDLYSSIHAVRAIELLETQGLAAVKQSLTNLEERLKKRFRPSIRALLQDPRVVKARKLIAEYAERGGEHPKIPILADLVKKSFVSGSRRIMVFTNYRATAATLVENLNCVEGVSAVRLVGQTSKGSDTGLSQKQQTLLLEDFRSGTFNILVATQIGEEGLDIVECDHVIFYDTVPSAIRYIQRRGRTGRRGPGKVTALVTLGTRDEAYYWIALRRERMMRQALKEISLEGTPTTAVDQYQLEKFIAPDDPSRTIASAVEVIVDSREVGSVATRELSRLGVRLRDQTLEVGDYVLSDRAVAERKTVDDLASSIIDGRLFSQAKLLADGCELPLLIVEGENLTPSRAVRPESMIGAAVSLIIDFGIPLIWARNATETAQYLYAIARREQMEYKRMPRVRIERKPESLAGQQEFVVAGLPSVDVTLARRLLKAFGNVQNVFVASEKELQQVDGIGKKISESIRRVISSAYKERD